MSRFAVLLLSILFSAPIWAQGTLLVSTHPIYLIAKHVTQGIEEPKLLLDKQTGHDVQLTPANRKAIQDAELIIWLGKAHEAPLERVFNQNKKAIAILDSGIIQTLPLRNSRGVALHNTIDTHVWLDPNNAIRIGFFIAALRSQQYPKDKQAYWANARQFAKELNLMAQKVNASANSKPYWAYHDAYQYLERPLNLKFAGALTEDPHVAPTVNQIKYLNDNKTYKTMCLLAEANVSMNQYQKLGSTVFQSVDENLTRDQSFLRAWQDLSNKVVGCVNKMQK
jgi:zinc transport system substrate-binding protein